MSHTVSALSPAELTSYRNALKNRVITARSDVDSHLKKAREVASRAALLLKKEFGIRKVVGSGSLVQPDLFHLRSDIDLAVWELKGRDYFRAVGILQSLDPDFEVDLVVFDDASKSIQKAILSEGKEL